MIILFSVLAYNLFKDYKVFINDYGRQFEFDQLNNFFMYKKKKKKFRLKT